MWLYEQSTGIMRRPLGDELATGYSGKALGKNNPKWEGIRNTGPIPRGDWFMKLLIPETTNHGPDVIVLEPVAVRQLFARSGFMIHGDSLAHPGMASDGCIILPRAARKEMWAAKDHMVRVIEGPPLPKRNKLPDPPLAEGK